MFSKKEEKQLCLLPPYLYIVIHVMTVVWRCLLCCPKPCLYLDDAKFRKHFCLNSFMVISEKGMLFPFSNPICVWGLSVFHTLSPPSATIQSHLKPKKEMNMRIKINYNSLALHLREYICNYNEMRYFKLSCFYWRTKKSKLNSTKVNLPFVEMGEGHFVLLNSSGNIRRC